MTYPIHKFSVVDSTSSRAMELFDQGVPAPFAVWSQEQTAGRGRRGRSWQSGEGNLYLTIALPPTSWRIQERGLVPIAVGIVVIDWLEEHYGVCARLKWPNDIVVGWQKLGGILCETSVQGDQWSALYVGIGLNILSVPEGDFDYGATCLSRTTRRRLTTSAAEDAAASLVDFFSRRWPDLGDTVILADFARKSIHRGLPWIATASANTVALNEDIRPNGSFCFVDSADSKEITVSTSHNDFQCLYLNPRTEHPFFAIDLGNTSVKIACFCPFSPGNPPQSRSIHLQALSLEKVRVALEAISPKEWSRPGRWPIYLSSVNRRYEGAVRDYLGELGFLTVAVRKQQVYRARTSLYRLEDLGIDRLALIESWLGNQRLASVELPVVGILVGAGTATTIDVVESTGRHVMGEILPGLQLSLTALADHTSLLPRLELDTMGSISTPGTTTVTAMTRAVFDMTIGAIERCQRAYLALADVHPNPRFELVVTGGYARFLAPELGVDETQNAVLNGIRILVLGM